MWVEKHPRSYFKKVKARENLEILKYVEENTPLLSDPYYLISTKVYWILHGLTDFPKCVVCGKPITKNIKVTEGYVHEQCLILFATVGRNHEISYALVNTESYFSLRTKTRKW